MTRTATVKIIGDAASHLKHGVWQALVAREVPKRA
jgi:hypothetical protein